MPECKAINLTLPSAYVEELKTITSRNRRVGQKRNRGSVNYLTGAVADCVRFALAHPDFPKFVRCWRSPMMQDSLKGPDEDIRFASALISILTGQDQ